jgi:hypothetical protein
MEEVELSASSYPETMSPPSKDTEPYLHLPPGYHAHLDPDVLVLIGADSSQVALFSSRGFVAEEVEQAAWEDYGSVVVSGGTLPVPVAPLSLLRDL